MYSIWTQVQKQSKIGSRYPFQCTGGSPYAGIHPPCHLHTEAAMEIADRMEVVLARGLLLYIAISKHDRAGVGIIPGHLRLFSSYCLAWLDNEMGGADDWLGVKVQQSVSRITCKNALTIHSRELCVMRMVPCHCRRPPRRQEQLVEIVQAPSSAQHLSNAEVSADQQ